MPSAAPAIAQQHGRAVRLFEALDLVREAPVERELAYDLVRFGLARARARRGLPRAAPRASTPLLAQRVVQHARDSAAQRAPRSRPGLQRDDERVLHGVLGRVRIPHQPRREPAQPLEVLQRELARS